MKQNENPDVRVKQRQVMLCRTANKEIKRNKVALGRNVLKHANALLLDFILHAFS